MSVNDLWITSIEPVQTLINPSTMIPGKPTIFKVVVASTFMVEKQTHILITCSESGQPTVSWYEGPYNIMPNQETVIYTGGQQVWGQNYRPSGEFDVKIKIDAFNKVPESNEINNEFVKRIGPQNSYTFKNLGRLKVLYVPVGFWAGPQAWLLGDPKIPTDNMTREASFTDSFIRAVFPVDMNLYKSAIASEYPLPCPYFIDPWSRRVWAAAVIAELDSVIKLYHQPSMGGYDRIVLVVPDRDGELWLKYWLNKDALGMTLLQNDITGWDTVCWCQEGYWTTPAHELWHTYSHISDDTWHCSNSETGYWDYAHSRGYSGLVNGGLPMPCMMSGDDKEYGESDWAYGWICRLCYANLTNLSRFKICNDPEVLFVSGVIFDNDTVNLQPFYHFPNGYADLEPGNTGNYTLRFLDVDQQVLSDVGFNMTFESDFNVTGFGFAVPYMDGVAQIQILHGENVIVSRIVSANAPTVNLTYPNSGETFVSGENITITWEASDADNDTLSFTVLYTPDNGTSWIPIQTGVTETSLNWTVPNDHSTDQCQIKVVATDGVNTGDDLSNVMFAILRHDVAVLDITTSTNRICGGDVLPFDVTVENCGNYTETFTLEAYANTTLLQAQNVTLTSGNITTVPLTWNTSGFAEGSYVVKAYIPQVLGEVNTLDNQYAHGIVEIDSTPPTIAILSPQNKTYYSPYIPLTFETNEPVSWIAYSLNNQPNITISGNTIIDIADGTHQIIVYANDTAGNTGPSQTIHFTINSSLHDPWKSSLIGPGNYPIVDFAVYNGRFYAAADNKLYVYDKYSWNIINAPAYITSLIAHEDKLIIGARDGLYYSLDGKTMFSLIFSVPTYIKVLGSYNNTLYAGTMLDNPPKLYYCNGSAENPADWQEDTDFSAILNFSGPFGSIDSFAEYNGILYITSGGTIYSFNETDWNVANTFDDVYGFSSMKVYNSKLYLATRDQGWRKPFYQGGTGFSGRVIEFDGENWTTVLDHCYWVYSLEEYDGKLYAGTANKILTYNGTDWETSFNATEGAYYALCFENYDGKIYAGMGNGYIFADPVSEIATAAELQPSAAVPEFSSTTLALLPMILSLSAIILQQCCTDRNGDEEKPLLA
jgi:hypothetical protein